MMHFNYIQEPVLITVIIIAAIGQRNLIFMNINFLNSEKAFKIIRVGLADIFRLLAVKTQHIVSDWVNPCNL